MSLPPLVIGEALARQWKLILLLTVIGALAGAAVGFSRPAVYTSESELNVGSLNAQAQAIPGYAEASQTLAEAYARAVQTNQIQAPVARRTHLPLSTVQTSLTAANIPGNPIFRIDGTGPTAATAQAVATAATREIVRYAHKRTSPPGAVAALNGYTQATVLANQLSSKAGRLKARFGSNPTPAQQATLALVQRAAAAAQLQAGAQQQSYVNAVGNQTTAGSVTLLNPAGLATSNRSRIAEIAGFAGAIVGCLIGCALAIRVAARRRRQLIQALMADYETVI